MNRLSKKLIIVESPSKSHTIEKYLGKEYHVVASKGHIRDLATTGKYGLGVDIEHGFKPNYEEIPGKKKLIADLKKLAKSADHVYLATDPDREGEAISWHLKDALDIKDEDYDRVLFYEITKNKVLEGLSSPTKIDENLVHSQETRRILDRIIGFRLSKLMQRKTGGKSAGRVQSVALKLVVDREREIQNFVPEEYWTITAHFDSYDSELFQHHHKKIELHNEEEANAVLKDLKDIFIVESIESKIKNKSSKPPYITSTLQQDASNKLNFPAKKTMSIAQKLYEGIDLGSETTGLITYMRTDSTRLSADFINPARAQIEKKYGHDYVGAVKKSKNTEHIQDGHEAIRPTSVMRTPESVKEYLSSDEYKLYSLIYARALASLMADAKVNATTVVLDNNDYQFKTTGQVLVFDGYLKVYKDFESSEDKIIPDFEKLKGTNLKANDIESKQHFTQPPARYTEAKLIHEMEELGIGRPSTYAKTMDTIKERNYVTMVDKKFVPTEIGMETTDKLQEYFADVINVKYTAQMETDLDTIAQGELDGEKVLEDFYGKFSEEIDNAFANMEKKAPEETGENCPNCGSPLVKRKGKYGEFVACSNYPTCKYIKKEEKEQKEVCTCLKCGHPIVERKTKKGKIFYGCSNYPKCKEAFWDKPTGDACPECGAMLVIKNNNICCSSCDYEK